MAAILLDISVEATWPTDNPSSLAWTLTACNPSRLYLRPWLCRIVVSAMGSDASTASF
jgi:hypothetical protein